MSREEGVHYKAETYIIRTIGAETVWAFVRDLNTNALYIPFLPTMVPMFASSRQFETQHSHFKDRMGGNYVPGNTNVARAIRSRLAAYYALWRSQNKFVYRNSKYYTLDMAIEFYKMAYTFMSSPYNTKTVYDSLVEELTQIKDGVHPILSVVLEDNAENAQPQEEEEEPSGEEASSEDPERAPIKKVKLRVKPVERQAIEVYMASESWRVAKEEFQTAEFHKLRAAVAKQRAKFAKDTAKLKADYQADIKRKRAELENYNEVAKERAVVALMNQPDTKDEATDRYTKTHEAALKQHLLEELGKDVEFQERALAQLGYTETKLVNMAVARRSNTEEVRQRAVTLRMEMMPARKRSRVEDTPEDTLGSSTMPYIEVVDLTLPVPEPLDEAPRDPPPSA